MKRFQIFFDELSIVIVAKTLREALAEFEEIAIYEKIHDVIELT